MSSESQPSSAQDDLRQMHRHAITNDGVRTVMFYLIDQLRAARQNQGMSQAELAQRMGSSQSAVSKLETASHVPFLDSFIGHVVALGGQITVTFPETGQPNQDDGGC